mgnify:CR=1 FL=1
MNNTVYGLLGVGVLALGVYLVGPDQVAHGALDLYVDTKLWLYPPTRKLPTTSHTSMMSEGYVTKMGNWLVWHLEPVVPKLISLSTELHNFSLNTELELTTDQESILLETIARFAGPNGDFSPGSQPPLKVVLEQLQLEGFIIEDQFPTELELENEDNMETFRLG